MEIPETLQPLHTFFMVVSFILGTLVGSFCNVCVSRWPSGESVVSPRSRCPKCRNAIAWYDNIPILSWLILGARCRHCGQPISWQYPAVEALTGVLFFAVYWRFGMSAATPVYMLLCAGLVIVTFQDFADWTIPNEITFPGIPLGAGVAVLGMLYPESGLRITAPLTALDGLVLGAFIICFLDCAVALVARKPGMGFGDTKLLAMLGAFLGWKGVLGILMFASLAGSAAGLAMIFYIKMKNRGEEAEEAAEDDDAPLPPPPVEPLSAIIVGIGGLYLFLRILNHYRMGDVPPELRPVILTGAVLLVLSAAAVALISLALYRRQLEAEKKHPHRHEADQSAEDEEDEGITLEGHYLPFGPWLALGGVVFLFFGPELIDFYFTALGAGESITPIIIQ
jgi:leader peptidase (prepilin peptidase) / N-methyltransferase